MCPRLSIIAIDDHPLFLKGIADYLCDLPIIKSVRICTDYAELMQKMVEEVPDILFLDINIPPHNGFTICEEIKRNYPAVFVAMLTQYDSEQFVQKAKKCGAGAYFLKNTDSEIILWFLQSLVSNHIKGFFAHVPETHKRKIDFEQSGFELRELLTHREQEILGMLLKRVSHKEIENNLGISNSTFKMHRGNIFRKLNVANDFELALFSTKYGLREN